MFRSVRVLATLMLLPGFAGAQVEPGNPPATHVVVRGETLWALAQRYLGDPFRWPLIFEANRSKIEDPDLIFPGQRFVIPGPGETAAVSGIAVVAEGREVRAVAVPSRVSEVRPESGGRVAGAPCPDLEHRTIFFAGPERDRGCPLPRPSAEDRTSFYPPRAEETGGGSEAIRPRMVSPGGSRPPEGRVSFAVPRSLVYSAEWLQPRGGKDPAIGTLTGFVEPLAQHPSEHRALTFDKLRVSLAPGQEVRTGDLLQSFRVLRRIEGLGTVLRPTGILTVLTVEGGEAVAMVSAEFDRVRVGDPLRRAPAYELRAGVFAEPVESNVTATVLAFAEDRPLQGIQARALLDVGEREGIRVGDEFRGFVNEPGPAFGTESARFQVIRVEGDTSTARVLSIRVPVLAVGDRLRLVKKMGP